MAAKAARLDVVSSTLAYGGRAVAGSSTADPVWQIREVTVVGTETIVKFADGDTLYDNVWDDRASLSYTG